MYAAIDKWMRQVYAGHILAKALVSEEASRGGHGPIQEALDLKAKLPSIIDGMPEAGKWSTEVAGVRIGIESTGMKTQAGDPLYFMGYGKGKTVFKAPAVKRHILLMGLEEAINKAIRSIEAKPKMHEEGDSRIVERSLLKAECLKYTSGPKLYRAKATAKFPVDLEGWKYLADWSTEKVKPLQANAKQVWDAAAKLRDMAAKLRAGQHSEEVSIPGKQSNDPGAIMGWDPTAPGRTYWIARTDDRYRLYEARPDRSYGSEDFKEPGDLLDPQKFRMIGPLRTFGDLLDLTKDIADPVKWAKRLFSGQITVVLNFIPQKRTEGRFNWIDGVVEVDLQRVSASSVDGFRAGLAESEETLRHELQHFGQTALDRLLGRSDSGGMPKHRTTPAEEQTLPLDKANKSKVEHPLRDEEFHTRLADEVEHFLRTRRTLPKVGWGYYAKLWVGLAPEMPEGLSALKQTNRWRMPTIGASVFFQRLKKYQPDKWRDAVREFMKQVL